MNIPSRVFVTGANGFIGRSLMHRFRELGSAVCGMDLRADPAWNVVAGDISLPGTWQDAAKGCELVIHTAAVVSNSAPADLYRRVSVGSVRHVVDAAIRGNASRVVHLSSIAAYGLDFTSERNETSDISLLSGFPYCDAKAASEHALLAAHAAGEISGTIIRPGDVYGPGSRPWVLIPLEMMKKRQFLLPENGNGIFSPVYIDNLLDGIVNASLSEKGSGEIFNITDGNDISCREFFSHHHRWLGRKGDPLCLPTRIAEPLSMTGEWLMKKVLRQETEISKGTFAMLTRKAGYSIAKAQNRLGYAPSVTLHAGMELTAAWLKEQRILT